MEEIWKDVAGYEGHYKISNFGRVKSLKKGKERILKPVSTAQGYHCVTMQIGGDNRKVFLIHRLVGLHFLEKENFQYMINHKDGIKTNNHVSNLEWCTHLENNNHAFDNRLIKIAFRVKLIRQCDGEVFTFKSQKDASFFLGKSAKYISQKKHKKIEFAEDDKYIYRIEIL